ERSDFVDVAAGLRAFLPQPDLRLGRLQDHQIQSVLLRQLVTVGQRLRKVVERLEEQHRDVRPDLPDHVREDDALVLEARRNRGLLRVFQLFGDEVERLRYKIEPRVPSPELRLIRSTHFRMSSRALRTASRASASVAAPRASFT